MAQPSEKQPIDFSLADGKGYALTRSHSAAGRLNLQHYLWKDSIKYLIHPRIPASESMVLADVATGTAIWLIDLARGFQKAKLEGFDIDVSQASNSHWLPSNVSIREWNMFDDPPSEMVARYDIVHVRLIVLAIDDGDPTLVVENLFKLLKPGGYLQWDELNARDTAVKKVDPALKTPALDELKIMSIAGGRHNWTMRIPEYLKAAGFEDTILEHYDDSDDMIKILNDQHMLTMDEFALRLLKDGQNEAAAKFFEVVGNADAETLKGAALCFPRIVCIGRKPL